MWVAANCYDAECTRPRGFDRPRSGCYTKLRRGLAAGNCSKPRGKQAADGLACDGGIAGQHAQQHRESIGGRSFEVQQDGPSASDHAEPPRKFAERFLADVVADLTSQLQRFLQQAQGVIHAVKSPWISVTFVTSHPAIVALWSALPRPRQRRIHRCHGRGKVRGFDGLTDS